MNKKGFTLAELLAVIVIIALIILIIVPIMGEVLYEARRDSFQNDVSSLFNVASIENSSNSRHKTFLLKERKLHSVEGNKEIQFRGNVNGSGYIYISPEKEAAFICNDAWCVEKIGENFVVTEVDENLAFSTKALLTYNELDENENFNSLFMVFSENTITEMKYIINRSATPLISTSPLWDTANHIPEAFSNVELGVAEAGVYYVHTLAVDSLANRTVNVSDPIFMNPNDENRVAELVQLRDFIGAAVTPNRDVRYDMIDPSRYENSTIPEIIKDFKLLQRAGYDGVVVEKVGMASGGIGDASLNINTAWYNIGESIYSGSTTKYSVIEKIMEAAETTGIQVFLGNVAIKDWSNPNVISNLDWQNAIAQMFISVNTELHTLYSGSSSFAGFYFNNEIFTNNINLESYWANVINQVVVNVNSLAGSPTFKVGAHISGKYNATPAEVQSGFTSLVSGVGFRNGDRILLKDGFGLGHYKPIDVFAHAEAIQTAVATSATTLSLNFVVENGSYSEKNEIASIERYKEQLNTVARFGGDFYSYSYLENYNFFAKDNLNEKISTSYDKGFREFIGQDTSADSAITALYAPAGGSVFVDVDGREAPVPAGFNVSLSLDERKIENGLVIHDSLGNQFVWVPVDLGVKAKGYNYGSNETDKVAYARYLTNGITDLAPLNSHTMPTGVTSEAAQIEKYRGFYIGRYESTYEHSGGTRRVMIKPTTDDKISTSFAWASATIANDGYLWNNITYVDAKAKAEAMRTHYGYTPRTGLVTGTQWDTFLRWIYVNNQEKTIIDDGRGWGNYNNSVFPASGGNYQVGTLKGTGTNDTWYINNVADVAGNLREWTAETNGSQYVIRSNGYDGSGLSGGPSYSVLSNSTAAANTGFRVVLYID